MRTFPLHTISEYRTELMGLSAIMILVCHAAGNDLAMPYYLRLIIAQGGIGVDIFLLLSGVGMYYSLSKVVRGVNSWYLRRYAKLLIPYLIITIPFSAYQCISAGKSFWYFLSTVSTFQYWLTHQAAWFIALLIPLYALAPALYRFLKRKGLAKFIVVAITCYIVSFGQFGAEPRSVLANIQFAVARAPVFVLGMLLGPKIMNGESFDLRLIIPMLIAVCIMMVWLRSPLPAYLFIVLPVVFLLVWVLDNNVFKGKFNDCCRFFGGISLESYLFNTALPPYIVLLLAALNIPDSGHYIMYTIVIVLGTVMSVVVKKLSDRIFHKLNYR